MRIGIDISQLAFENTGVANYLENLLVGLLKLDRENEYVLFYSSLRKRLNFEKFNTHRNVTVKSFKIPPVLLELIWNRLHVLPIEQFIGDIDIFISSDWTQPPTRAKKFTILYDLIVYKFPKESHDEFRFSLKNFSIRPNIVESQKRRLNWVKKECDAILCISESTKKDAMKLIHIGEEKLHVVYPGI